MEQQLTKRMVEILEGRLPAGPELRMADVLAVQLPAGVRAWMAGTVAGRLSENLQLGPHLSQAAGQGATQRVTHAVVASLVPQYRISRGDLVHLLHEAVAFVEAYLRRPRSTLARFLAADAERVGVAEILSRLDMITEYRYLGVVLVRLLAGRAEVDHRELGRLIARVDAEVVRTHGPEELARLMAPLFSWYSLAGVPGIPREAVRDFLDDKEMGALRDYIESVARIRGQTMLTAEEVSGFAADLMQKETPKEEPPKPQERAPEAAAPREEKEKGRESRKAPPAKSRFILEEQGEPVGLADNFEGAAAAGSQSRKKKKEVESDAATAGAASAAASPEIPGATEKEAGPAAGGTENKGGDEFAGGRDKSPDVPAPEAAAPAGYPADGFRQTDGEQAATGPTKSKATAPAGPPAVGPAEGKDADQFSGGREAQQVASGGGSDLQTAETAGASGAQTGSPPDRWRAGQTSGPQTGLPNRAPAGDSRPIWPERGEPRSPWKLQGEAPGAQAPREQAPGGQASKQQESPPASPPFDASSMPLRGPQGPLDKLGASFKETVRRNFALSLTSAGLREGTPAKPPLASEFTENQRTALTATLFHNDAAFFDRTVETLAGLPGWRAATRYLTDFLEAHRLNPYANDVLEFTRVVRQWFVGKEERP